MISIITPFYYGNKYINQLIELVNENARILHIKYPEIFVEHIIVNDSPEIKVGVAEVQSDISVKIVENNKNMGIHYSRVIGLECCKGDFVLFLDQDDKIDNTFLLSQYEGIGENDVIVSLGIHEKVDEKIYFYKNKYQHNCVKKLKNYLAIRQQIASPGQCLIRKASIPKEWNQMIMSSNGADDYFLWILMLAQSKKFEVNDKVLYYHVITGENKSLELKNMDISVDEMIKYLSEVSYISKKQIKLINRCNDYKQNYRYAGILMKLVYSIKYFDLAIRNVVFHLFWNIRKK